MVVRLRWRMSRGDAAVTALAASYVNANNLGIPIAAYVLGDTTVIAPVLLFQLGLHGTSWPQRWRTTAPSPSRATPSP